MRDCQVFFGCSMIKKTVHKQKQFCRTPSFFFINAASSWYVFNLFFFFCAKEFSHSCFIIALRLFAFLVKENKFEFWNSLHVAASSSERTKKRVIFEVTLFNEGDFRLLNTSLWKVIFNCIVAKVCLFIVRRARLKFERRMILKSS